MEPPSPARPALAAALLAVAAATVTVIVGLPAVDVAHLLAQL